MNPKIASLDSTSRTMRALFMSLSSLAVLCSCLVLLQQGSEVQAWGGLFNRFNPSMLSELGYGNSYGSKLYGVQHKAKTAPSLVEDALDNEADEDEDPCVAKRCTANEHCCEGDVCVDTEEISHDITYGTCLPIFGKKQGEQCFRDNDCESGFLCLKGLDGIKSCQQPVPGTQTLGEDCGTSSDCNISKGLCCKLQRRARSQPKKICTYFTDPMVCIGPVATSQVRTSIEHTAGEKRISGHPDFNHLK